MKNIEYLKVLYTIAWADSKITKEEILYLNEIEHDLELHEIDTIKEWQSNKLTIEDIKGIDFTTWSIYQKKYILLLSIAVAESDGDYSNSEHLFMKELSKLLDLEDIGKQDLIKDIEKSNALHS